MGDDEWAYDEAKATAWAIVGAGSTAHRVEFSEKDKLLVDVGIGAGIAACLQTLRKLGLVDFQWNVDGDGGD